MIRLTLIQGHYRVEPLGQRSRDWLADYAAARPTLNASEGRVMVDPRFLGDMLDAAARDGIPVERPNPRDRGQDER